VRPAFAGTPSIPVIHAAQWITERHARAGTRVLVVGGATSAVEIAEHCARRGCVTTVAARRLALGPQTIFGIDPSVAVLPLLAHLRPRRFCGGATVPAGDRGFAELRKRGALAVHREPTRIDGNVATLADGHRCEIDLVVLATGYRHEAPFLPGDLARTPRGLARCRDNESVSHRGLFVVGSPCARSAASQYLYGIARDAEAVARVIAMR
jgi:cation diffusion facilitator CzcD-associated flavoprotein CzcO